MSDQIPSPEELRKLMEYDPDTGALTWRHRSDAQKSWNTRYAETPALNCVHADGYKKGRIARKLYRAHRVAWAIHTGRWPDHHIDHVNGDRSDNRIKNLRDVPRSENQKNMCKPSDNTSGRIGVWWHKQNAKWIAEIRVDKRKKHLGSFTTFDEACAAREKAEIEHGYHKNHGR